MNLLIWKFFYFAVSSVPLYFALRLLRAKKAGFTKVVLVNILANIVASAILSSFGWLAGSLAFLAVLFVYKEMFELSWLSAFLAWLLNLVIMAVMLAIIILAFGAAALAVLAF